MSKVFFVLYKVLFFIWDSFIMLYNLYKLYFMLSDISFYVIWCNIELILIKKKIYVNIMWEEILSEMLCECFFYMMYDIFIWNLL